ncbi:MAG TPA: CHAP domain-containing protein [Intrasporangium sp.]|uniref:CHAP domain-containing protein n=1 Tax=Intrasporangium sp. TaxID=1925024 RepID=UPI002D7A2396|nr:CHAP domain-containing protein [Intrasporangium sp.]HET7399495.1 CHAP domain-containing protein [Intrasporangium sp.]
MTPLLARAPRLAAATLSAALLGGVGVALPASPASAASSAAYTYPADPGRGFIYLECGDFVAWRLGLTWRSFGFPSGRGGAVDWKAYAGNIGRVATSTPSVGDIAWWARGHVALVTAVAPDGSVTIEEFNGPRYHAYSVRSGMRADSYLHRKGAPVRSGASPKPATSTPAPGPGSSRGASPVDPRSTVAPERASRSASRQPVRVAPAPVVALGASKAWLRVGRSAQLGGTVRDAPDGAVVVVQRSAAPGAGTGWTSVARLTPAGDRSFTYTVVATDRTDYGWRAVMVDRAGAVVAVSPWSGITVL